MSTRRTFEDRLLDELKREIELREAGVRRTGPATAGPGGGGARAAVRRLFTPPRIAVVAVACAVAWFGAAVVPGSSAYSTAYAVERHGDGTVTLTVKDRTIGVAAQRELATRVRPWGIEVTIDVLAPGYVCERSFTPFSAWAVDGNGDRAPVVPIKAGWDFTLRRGNVLTFENMEGMSRPRAVELYSTRSQAEPCVPLKVTLPDD
ncbi:hypothetical protein [Streptomyces sp. Root1310]|uniref:hypothetical protein n=1 Tax=Streptomyces sp. Root1310 TaxID=1736452 RepID=UPI00070F349B|nr:hypothetical protein [Streptomyces sp. Root1310]KQX65013.1 hypothetical protein ASD48_18085 [Streptomyces sp. Root1310]